MATLGELFDQAAAHLDRAAGARLAAPSPAATSAALGALEPVLLRLRDGFLGPRPPWRSLGVSEAEQVLTENLHQTLWHIDQQIRRLPAPDHEAAAPIVPHLSDAHRLVTAVKDLISSHQDADQRPLTPYAHLLTTVPARDYLVSRTAELARQAAAVTRLLIDAGAGSGVDLIDARSFLDRAALTGAQAARTADIAISAFPTALPVQVLHDTARPETEALGDDCERLSRAAFELLQGRTDWPLSGSDLTHTARWMALTRLLSGRVLLRMAGEDTDTGTRATEALRQSYLAWRDVTRAWNRIVDTADPTAHPALPLPSYQHVLRGQVVRLPQITPHAATDISGLTTLRLGRLLYGEDWSPTSGPPPEARGATEIIADAAGEERLLTALYRLSATGWQLAVAAPAAVLRMRTGLVTDEPTLTPRPSNTGSPFQPVHPRQLDKVIELYGAAARADQDASAALLQLARASGVSVPRAALDVRAHQILSAEAAADIAQAGQARGPGVSSAAARARSTTTSRPVGAVRPVLQKRHPQAQQPDVPARGRTR